MKAADIAVLLLCLALAAGGYAAFYLWQAEEARGAEVAWEAEVDILVDRKIDAVQLGSLEQELAPHGEGRLQALTALYADRQRSDALNLGFGTLRADFATAYPRLAEDAGRPVDRGVLQIELDQRYGAGSYALMEANYEAFLADAPRRQQEEYERGQEQARAIVNYYQRYGRYPDGPFHIANGRVVEGPAPAPATP
jgi:hypothetical protein